MRYLVTDASGQRAALWLEADVTATLTHRNPPELAEGRDELCAGDDRLPLGQAGSDSLRRTIRICRDRPSSRSPSTERASASSAFATASLEAVALRVQPWELGCVRVITALNLRLEDELHVAGSLHGVHDIRSAMSLRRAADDQAAFASWEPLSHAYTEGRARSRSRRYPGDGEFNRSSQHR